MKLCIITCYNQPDYVRAKTLRAAFRDAGHDVIVVKNDATGLLRYVQVLRRLMAVKRTDSPDVYVLTFRGYEMLLPVRLITRGRPLMYDEFINPIEWVVKEERKVEAKTGSNRAYALLVKFVSWFIVRIVASGAFKLFYRKLANSADLILTDTISHADISAELTGVDRKKFAAVPVGTDETTFTYNTSERPQNERFIVLYYGNMLPLHGLKYVIEAAVKMNHDPVRFVLVGGDSRVAHDVAFAVGNGANIDYKAWVDFGKLPALMRAADLCLAGPFGGTFQSRFVVTGKAYQFMAMGRPIVVGANQESDVFTDKKNAMVVEQANADSLVKAIRWAMKHETKLNGIGKAGRELYDREFSAPALARATEKLLDGLRSQS